MDALSKVEANELKYGETKRNNYAQSNIGKPDRLLDDDGGHLIRQFLKVQVILITCFR
ncbi:hypothetical protein ACEQPO_16990 [Bacillus sp. SL00103]